MHVKRRDNETIDQLLARFEKLFRNSGISQELKNTREYTKPSTVARLHKQRVQRNIKRRENRRLANNLGMAARHDYSNPPVLEI